MPKLVAPPPFNEVEWNLEAELCRRSFAHFVRRFWSVCEPGTPIIWGWHIQAICDHLQAIDEGIFNKLIICIPPGFAKSTLVSCLWPAWSWLHRPWLRSLFGSYDEKLTYRDSVKCKDIIKSKLYQELFNPEWQMRSDISSKGYFANDMQGARKTYYIGSSHKTGWRANYVIIDDPLSAEDRYDSRIKKNVIDSWDKVLSTRANRSQHHAFVVIMQRLACDDLVGYLIGKYGDGYVQLILPVEFDPDRRCDTPIFSDPRTKKGELLAPDFFPQKQVDEAKLMGEVDYQAQFNHSPYPLGGDRFKAEYFQFWKYSTVSREIIELHNRSGIIDHIRIRTCQRFLSVDFAASEKTQSDYTVAGLWALTDQCQLVLLYRVKLKGKEDEIIRVVKELYRLGQFGPIPPSTVYAEQNGLGLPIAQHLQNEGLPVEFINVHKDKFVMSASAAVRIQSGQMFFPDHSVYPWMHEFVEELLSFPAAQHDDSVSMISIASNSVFERRDGSPRSVVTIPQGKPQHNAVKVKADLASHNLFGVNGNGDNRQVSGGGFGNGYNGHSNGNGTRRHT